MLRMGDEVGQSQGGNNNAYCQDNAVSWTDWTALLTRSARRLAPPVHPEPGGDPQGAPDVPQGDLLPRHHRGREQASAISSGSRPAGRRCTARDWREPSAAALVMRTQGDALGIVDRNGGRG